MEESREADPSEPAPAISEQLPQKQDMLPEKTPDTYDGPVEDEKVASTDPAPQQHSALAVQPPEVVNSPTQGAADKHDADSVDNKDDDSDAGSDHEKKVAQAIQDSPQSLLGDLTYAWLKKLSARMSSLEKNVKTSEKKTTEAKKEPTALCDDYMSSTIPDVKTCNWEQFKNRYPEDGGIYAIEVLPSSKGLDADMEAEQLRRVKPEEKSRLLQARGSTRIPTPKAGPGTDRLERVRINSAFVLEHLSKVTGEQWAGKPHTFLRPFKILIHFHKKMEDEYDRLAADVDNVGEQVSTTSGHVQQDGYTEPLVHAAADHRSQATSSQLALSKGETPVTEDTPTVEDGNLPRVNVSWPAKNTRKAYEDMKCYINFIKSRILSVYSMFDVVDLNKSTRVRYHDLYSLFRVGELVVQRSRNYSDKGRRELHVDGTQQGLQNSYDATTEPLVGRCFWTCGEFPDWGVDDLAGEGSSGRLRRDPDDSSDSDDEREDTRIGFYYIDFDGDEYGAVTKMFDIDHYEGEIEVTTLPVYPLRFSKDHQQIVQNAQTRGEKFRRIMGKSTLHNMSYEGWTLIKTPLGDRVRGEDGRQSLLNRPEHVDSDIVIDFREAYRSRPHWQPEFSTYRRIPFMPQTVDDNFSIIEWIDADRTESVRRYNEVVIDKDVICNLELSELIDKPEGTILIAPEIRTPEQSAAARSLSAANLVLLPSRLFAYAFRERKFVHANLRCIKEKPDALDTFERLRISDKHKSFIQSLVFEHFQKKAAQKQSLAKDREIPDQDFIRGKGKGLVILLHGAPGVGKTATAEAVSQTHNKPLFMITCGNLGTEPEAVESKLGELFRLASLWDCILLLDEAEIFLSPREKTDDNLQRNALVSVFLRILEYYSGILFLTTNRPGALDEAVKSRVHLSLNFPHLGLDETTSLFRMNIERLVMIEKETAIANGKTEMDIDKDGIMDFARNHFYKFEGPLKVDSRWNGRQIRNAFQIAASLARYNNHLRPTDRFYVGAYHFKQIEEATLEYDEFRKRTAKKTETELAASKLDRGSDAPEADRRGGGQHSGAQPPQMQHWHTAPNIPTTSRGGGEQWDPHGPHAESPSRARPPYDTSSGFGTPTRPQAQRYSLSPSESVRTDAHSESGGWGGGGTQGYSVGDYR